MLEKKELLQKNLSLLLSYLEVIPSDQNHTNKIYSIANKNIEYETKKCGKVKVSRSYKVTYNFFSFLYKKYKV